MIATRACPLARFDPGHDCRYRADGQPDPCHWIPKQRLIAEYTRRGYPNQVIVLAANDPRILTDGCRRHHDQLDGRNAIKAFRLEYEDYPQSVHDYAREFSWWWANPERGWRVDRMLLEVNPPPGLLIDFQPAPKENPDGSL